jgi:hypothetical protein
MLRRAITRFIYRRFLGIAIQETDRWVEIRRVFSCPPVECPTPSFEGKYLVLTDRQERVETNNGRSHKFVEINKIYIDLCDLTGRPERLNRSHMVYRLIQPTVFKLRIAKR